MLAGVRLVVMNASVMNARVRAVTRYIVFFYVRRPFPYDCGFYGFLFGFGNRLLVWL